MLKPPISNRRRILIPLVSGLLASGVLAAIYFGVVSWAESPSHAAEFFWQDRWIVTPILLGFGVQASLYTILRFRLFFPNTQFASSENKGSVIPSGASVGASGSTSAIAMVACCLHHVTDVLPILGLTVAATFLAKYRLTFMYVGLGSTLLGIGYILFVLFRERRIAMRNNSITISASEVS